LAQFVPICRAVANAIDASRPSVLVAESEPDLRRVLGYLLRDARYEAAFATDAIDVVSAIARDCPDVLVLDLQLARLDGLLTLELVRAMAGRLPVVLISSIADPALEQAAARFGVLAVLTKPFRNTDLLDAIARAIGPQPMAVTGGG
jgi:CheY-like chemotaxis protein